MSFESDMANRDFAGASNPDGALMVQFYTMPEDQPLLSEKAGHPVYKDRDMVRIMIPGRNDLTIERPIDDRDKARFPLQWAHFMNTHGSTEQVVGTPVTEWPAITRSQAEEMRGLKFFTVEQIANCSDSQIQALGMNGNHLRIKARAYLQTAKDSALAQSQAVELEKRDQENAELREQLATLTAAVQGLQQQKPAKAAKPEKKERVINEGARQAARDRMLAMHAKKREQKDQAEMQAKP